ncbi:MAG: SRPBCC domain-containing protein [Ignavibacteriaceae bacterium]|nr:SRPBCC domain-containing protein [Ignavibacteriaceae bacterium]
MKKIQISHKINAPKSKVWQMMLEKEPYSIWTFDFDPGSRYEGELSQGSEIKFLAHNGAGLLGYIDKFEYERFISFRFKGEIVNGKEILGFPENSNWTESYENYKFSEENGVTVVEIECLAPEEHYEFMSQMWGSAIKRLEQICVAPFVMKTSIEINTSIEKVWFSITDSEEFSKWLPQVKLISKFENGSAIEVQAVNPDGSIMIVDGKEIKWNGVIEKFEPTNEFTNYYDNESTDLIRESFFLFPLGDSKTNISLIQTCRDYENSKGWKHGAETTLLALKNYLEKE